MSLIFQHEIRPGDTIKVTSQGGGVLVERTGTVANRPLSHGVLRTEEQSVLWDAGWAGMYSFDLIDRPVPPLPTKIGSIVLADDSLGCGAAIILNEKECWQYIIGGAYNLNHLKSWKLAKVVEA